MITKLKSLTEKQIESLILEWLNLQSDIFAFKVNTLGVFDPTRGIFRTNKNPFLHNGTSDIIGVCKGYFFALEVKTPKELKRVLTKPTPRDLRQREFIHQVEENYGFGGLVSNIEDAESIIHQIRSSHLSRRNFVTPQPMPAKDAMPVRK